MNDRQVLIVSVLCIFAAYFQIGCNIYVAIVLFAATLLIKYRWLTVAGLALLVGSHALELDHAIKRPLPKKIEGEVVLLSDSEVQPKFHSTHALIKFRDKKYELRCSVSNGYAFQGLQAGEVIFVEATVSPVPDKKSFSSKSEISGIASAKKVVKIGRTDGKYVLADKLRTVISSGASKLKPSNKDLFTGLIYGDDRNQSEVQKNEFIQSGLAHLTAVSGANVAFVILLFTPFIRRLKLFGRLIALALVLAIFGSMTRWEPSVVRAITMAIIILLSEAVGKPIGFARSVSLVVIVCLSFDPRLVYSIGFLLSVSACYSMALLGLRISEIVPGRRSFRQLVGFTVAAQLGVAPVQVFFFGTVPLVGLMTNLLAEPVAGFVMVWGLCSAVLCAFIPTLNFLQYPLNLCLDWIRFVAHVGSVFQNDFILRMCAFVLPVASLWSYRRRTTISGCGYEPERAKDPARIPNQR